MPFLSALAAALGTTGFGRGGASGPPIIEYLLVGGGGGAATGGGGGGGARFGTELELVEGETYTITIGSGGNAMSGEGANNASAGGSTLFQGNIPEIAPVGTLGCNGGGKGLGRGQVGPTQGVGASGGGNGADTSTGSGRNPEKYKTPANGFFAPGNLAGENIDRGIAPGGPWRQGHVGGLGTPAPYGNSGGGGGAGAAGGDAQGNAGGPGAGQIGGAGGDGVQVDISPAHGPYFGGGGAGGNNTNSNGTPAASGGQGGGGNANTNASGTGNAGTANTGGGGGGADYESSSTGGGGSGILIIKSTVQASATTGSPDETTDGALFRYVFTGDGSITF